MYNLFNRNCEILETLNEINEKLKKNDDIILYQSNEIEKTEKIMTDFQECLKNQKNALFEFSKEKEKLEEEKEKCLNLLRNNKSTMSDAEITIILDDDENDNEIFSTKSDLPDVKLDVIETTKSLKFYRAIIDNLYQVYPSNDMQYLNQTVIPNELKTSTSKRKMILRRIDTIGEYPLENLILQHLSQPLDIHIALGSGELISITTEGKQSQYNMTTLKANKSFGITRDQTIATDFVLSVIKEPMIIACEIHELDQDIPQCLTELPVQGGYMYMPDTYEDSFVKMSLSLDELRKRLLFIDASFALTVQDKLEPIAITVLDYFGKILINTVICPRVRIKDYFAIKHGLFERDIIGKPDGNEILDYLHTIVIDKVLVGHDLQDKIKNLKIDLKYLCGIRDLQSSVILKSIIDPSKSIFNLSIIANRILGEECSINAVHSANKNANIIRKAYIKVEYQWRDKIALPALGSYKDVMVRPKSKTAKSRLGWLSRLKSQNKKQTN